MHGFPLNKNFYTLSKMILHSSSKVALAFFFIFILLVQSFSGFASYPSSIHPESSLKVVFPNIDITPKQFVSPCTDQSGKNTLSLEAEDEFAEEDDIQENSNETTCDHISKHYTSEELFHTYRLNIQYLQVNSSIYHYSTLPLFILHHNWKNYLS